MTSLTILSTSNHGTNLLQTSLIPQFSVWRNHMAETCPSRPSTFPSTKATLDINFIEDYGSKEAENDYEYYDEEEEDEEDIHWLLAALVPSTKVSQQLDIKLPTLHMKKPIDFMKFSPNGQHLAIVLDGWLEMLVFPSLSITFKMLLRLPVISIFFTMDSSQLVCCYGTQLFESPSMEPISTFNKVQFEYTFSAFAPRLDIIVTSYEDGSIDVYNIASKNIVRQLLLFENSPIMYLTLTEDVSSLRRKKTW